MTGTDDSPAFARARSEFDVVVGFLGGEAAAGLTHTELETELGARGRELLRQFYQDHLDLRAEREVRLPEVVGADGVARHYAEDSHRRPLATVFGQVTLGRIAYRRKGGANLHPADGALNLPTERHSHGLRRLAAVEASRGSFEEAAVERATATRVGKRQVEELAARSAADVEAFYEAVGREGAEDGDVLVTSADGKGIVMRPGSLRAATERAAAGATTKSRGQSLTPRAHQASDRPESLRRRGVQARPPVHGKTRARPNLRALTRVTVGSAAAFKVAILEAAQRLARP